VTLRTATDIRPIVSVAVNVRFIFVGSTVKIYLKNMRYFDRITKDYTVNSDQADGNCIVHCPVSCGDKNCWKTLILSLKFIFCPIVTACVN